MTTIVVVIPHGHNVEVEQCHLVGDTTVSRVTNPDPWGEHRFAIYDTHSIIVREIEGWAEKPLMEDHR